MCKAQIAQGGGGGCGGQQGQGGSMMPPRVKVLELGRFGATAWPQHLPAV